MAAQLPTIVTEGVRIPEESGLSIEVTVSQGGTAVDWSTYTLKAGISDKAGDATYYDTDASTLTFTGSAAGVLNVQLTAARAATAVAAGRTQFIVICTATKASVTSRVWEIRGAYAPGKDT